MAEKKKPRPPKPGPSTGGSSTSRIKKPKGTQPLTLGTGGLRTSKISKKQMAGTRKVVGAIAAVTPVGRAASVAARAASKASVNRSINVAVKSAAKADKTGKARDVRKAVKAEQKSINKVLRSNNFSSVSGSYVKGSVNNPIGKSTPRTYTATEKLAAKNKALANSAKGMTQKPKSKTKPNPFNPKKANYTTAKSIVRQEERYGGSAAIEYTPRNLPGKKRIQRAYQANQKKKK